MADQTGIEWTDATWNPVTGCDRISPGCANCYALTLARRLKAMGQPGYQRDGGRASGPGFGVTLHPHKLAEPLRWRKPRRVFVNSMSDLFHDDVPYEFVREVFNVMRCCDGGTVAATGRREPAHTFQVLTKRPERALELWRDRKLGFGPGDQWPAHVWLGVSVENARYTWRADVLRQIPAAVRFISAEPLLGSLFPPRFECPSCEGQRYDRGSCATCENRGYLDGMGVPRRLPLDLSGIDWVIVGGESGPGARPCRLEWIREIVDACRKPDMHGAFLMHRQHGPAVFVKQLGAKPEQQGYGNRPWGLGLRDRKGGDPDEWPADLRIREFPRSATSA